MNSIKLFKVLDLGTTMTKLKILVRTLKALRLNHDLKRELIVEAPDQVPMTLILIK